MSNWIPTNELRFVDRQHEDGWWTTGILQQKWHLSDYIEGEGWKYSKTEWRDVPAVEEE